MGLPRRRLLPHQKKCLRWATPRESAALLMQMRLGKAVCGVRWADSRPKSDKILVIAPGSAIPGWAEEIAREGSQLCEIAGRTQEERERAVAAAGRDHRWYSLTWPGVLSREGGKTVPSAWVRLPWDVVILDESTAIRNPKAKTTRAVLDHLCDAPHRLLLTGLANPEGPEDYVTQMLFVGGGRFMGHRNFWEWRAEHMIAAGYGWSVRHSSLGALRTAVRECSFQMTRREAGFPDRVLRQTVWVDLPAPVMAAIKSARRDLEVGDRMTDNVLVAQTWEAQLAGGRFPGMEHSAKTDALVELATEGEFRGKKLLVWARYTEELRAAAAALNAAGVPAHLITGEVEQSKRRELAARFQRPGSGVQALVCQPQCMKMGVDLSAAAVSVILSNYFDLEVRRQVEDRVVNVAKREPSLIVDVVARGTVDEDVVEAIGDKNATAATFNKSMLGAARRARANA